MTAWVNDHNLPTCGKFVWTHRDNNVDHPDGYAQYTSASKNIYLTLGEKLLSTR